MGVAERHSLGLRDMPSAPMCAVTEVPTRSQPPPGALRHACRLATVLEVERALTVSTRVAVPVVPLTGRRTPRRGAAWCWTVLGRETGAAECVVGTARGRGFAAVVVGVGVGVAITARV